MASYRDALRLGPGPIDLRAAQTRSTPAFDGDKEAGRTALDQLADELADLQERLYARARAGIEGRRVLVILQGMDTAGKGGTIRQVAGRVDPQGVAISAFSAPTDEERAHDFLWRIERALPAPGRIGFFDRSHYEDVLIARVRALAEPSEIERRYEAINAFERDFVASGGILIKCLLHIGPDDQAERLAARLDDPSKHWKFTTEDVTERRRWPAYRTAYEIALERCRSVEAPWYLVPAGRKWYRNLAVAQLLLEYLRDLDLTWPPGAFDVEAARESLAASTVE